MLRTGGLGSEGGAVWRSEVVQGQVLVHQQLVIVHAASVIVITFHTHVAAAIVIPASRKAHPLDVRSSSNV